MIDGTSPRKTAPLPAAARRFGSISVVLLLVACSEPNELSPDILGRAVRDAGFPCDGSVGAREMGKGNWHVACGDGSTYLATVLDTGEICVDPIPLGDAPAGAAFQDLGEGRCAPDVKAQ